MTMSPQNNPGLQPDLTAINLTRLLARLEHNVLSPSADVKALVQSPYHRARVEANINHARMLLLQLEHSAPQIRIQSQKRTTQTDLAQKRQLIKRLSESIAAVTREADSDHLGNFEDEDALSEASEDLLAEVDRHAEDRAQMSNPASTPSMSSNDGASAPKAGQLTKAGTSEKQQETHEPVRQHTQHESTLRNRRAVEVGSQAQSANTAVSTSSSQRYDAKPHDQEAHTEALHSADTDHATLITSTLSLAQALKAKSLQFQTTLSGENAEVLNSALRALDRNQTGMSAAEKKMGRLRQMSEGQGWWGRMMLYAWIFGLWVIVILLVFVAPKFRF